MRTESYGLSVNASNGHQDGGKSGESHYCEGLEIVDMLVLTKMHDAVKSEKRNQRRL
jgi:hypothetical protein